MTTLFNTNLHTSMNDVSVTSGNADGWVIVPLDLRAPLPKKQEKKQSKRGAKKK
jgi:hypothetical protein